MPKVFLVVLSLVGLGAVLWHWAQNPVRLRPGEHRGVDVSAHQGSIDWRTVANSGIEFAYIKATEGGDWVDDHFQRNWRGAGQAGLRRGAYHFFTLRRPGLDQAENFLKTAPPEPDSLPPVIDLEFGGNTRVRPEKATVQRQLSIFLRRVESAYQRRALLYLLPEFEAAYGLQAAFPRQLWVRSLLMRPDEHTTWKIWQYTPLGQVAGIQGNVDLNVAAGLWD